MIEIIILLTIILLFFLLLYVFFLVRPRRKRKNSEKHLVEYAHRGLHGSGIPENSLSAFENAVNNGFGIELDVQLSKDGKVMVFHDYSLLRMTGCDKNLSELTLDELKALCLSGTIEKIPTFEEVLSLVNGRVPLLVELKGENFDSSLCGKTAEILKNYKGDYCVESFNPLLIKKMKSFLPDAFYGQLYTNVCRDKRRRSVLNVILTLMALNFLSRPDFIAYNKYDRKSIPVLIATRFFKAYKFVWTTKNEEEYQSAKNLGECPIFEKT